jgi:hypothetical protein
MFSAPVLLLLLFCLFTYFFCIVLSRLYDFT